jgi:hypothetical protein
LAYRYFKVNGDDGHMYFIRHDAITSRWELSRTDLREGDCTDTR